MVSLFLFVHLFLVLVALGGNYARSEIVDRLLNRFSFYTRFLNFDPNQTPFYLTHGTDADVDHHFEVLPRDSQSWLRLPDRGFRGQDGYQRLQRYAAEWSFQANNDGQPALFAQATGTHFSRRLGIVPSQIRCRKHFQQAREDLASSDPALRNPEDPSRFAIPYAANALVNSNGTVDVVRIEEAGQVAAPVLRASGPSGTRNP